jgi:septal ring factor EnvC (AmiA/AmiB activator)
MFGIGWGSANSFYQKDLESTNKQCASKIEKLEAEKSKIETTLNAEIKKLEVENTKLQTQKPDAKPEQLKTSTAATKGNKSNAINTGDNPTININNK